MNVEKMTSIVEALGDKALTCNDAGDAMRFAQAAGNAANAFRTLVDTLETLKRSGD